MKRSYVIALAGISAALAYVSIILSFYVDVMSISFGVLAGICLMLPFTVGNVSGAIFAYISSSILSGLTIGFGAMPYILFFGPFTIVGYLVDFPLYFKMKTAKWVKVLVGYIIKGITYSGTVTAVYFVMKAFGNVDVIIESKFLWVAIILLIALFFLFDILLHLVFINLRYIVNHRILKNKSVPYRRDDKVIEIPRSVEKEKPQDDNIFGEIASPHVEDTDSTENADDDIFDEKSEEKSEDTSPTKSEDVDESSNRFAHFLEVESKEKDKDSEDEDNKD